MPVVAVNLAAHVFREISELVSKGQFSSPEEFLATAAFNQLVLERGAKPEDLMGGAASPPTVEAALGGTAEGALVTQVEAPARKPRSGLAVSAPASGAVSAEASRISQVFERLHFSATESKALPDFVVPTPEAGPEARIWWQVNRLFPLKFVVRWLATEAVRQHEWPSLVHTLTEAPRDAALLGTHLELEDARQGRQRDEQLATGLPREFNEASEERFKNQVMARVTRTAVHPGATFQLLLTVTHGERIALTPEGFKLAALPSPILDRVPGVSTSLTDAERFLLLSIIAQRLPREHKDMSCVLDAVRRQHTTPDELQSEVRKGLPSEWTDVMVRTHITGLVSRSVDLGLLKRQWVGRNVTYSLTDAGKTFIG
jgi:hypothetical protein